MSKDNLISENNNANIGTNSSNNAIIKVLKKRPDFLFIAQGERAGGRFLSLQKRKPKMPLNNGNNALETQENASNAATNAETSVNDTIRYGITASKKVGNAVMRNRAKRRLRVLMKKFLPESGQKGFDYVAVARPQTVSANWSELEADVVKLISRLKQPNNGKGYRGKHNYSKPKPKS